MVKKKERERELGDDGILTFGLALFIVAFDLPHVQVRIQTCRGTGIGRLTCTVII